MGHPEDSPDDCMTCAACCFSESPRHARVTGDDHARLGDAAEDLITWVGNQAFMRLEAVGEGSPLHRCGALAVDPERGTFACSIYERRPQICRDLERGSPECRGELEAKAERPRRALRVLRALTASGRTSR
jgi:Fe-S-cluster containining protein